MGFLQKLKQVFSSPSSPPTLDIAVRCRRCHQVITGQINLQNDLSLEYDGDETYYFARKMLVGSGENRCFQTVTVEYTFDADRNVIDRRIEGGTFVDEES